MSELGNRFVQRVDENENVDRAGDEENIEHDPR